MSQINTLAEKMRLYRILNARFEKLLKCEEATGEAIPEVRESAVSMCRILEAIRLEGGGAKQSPEELKKEIFGDWMRKVQGEGEKNGSE